MQPPRGVTGLAVLVLAITLGACARTETVMMRVAPYKAGCATLAPSWCNLVAIDGSARSGYQYGGIEGFQYRWGFEYWVLVHVRHIDDPPSDGSSVEYSVKDVLEVQPVSPGTPFEITLFSRLVEGFDPETGGGTLDDGRMTFTVPLLEVRAQLSDFLATDTKWRRGTARFRFGEGVDAPLILEGLELEDTAP